MRCPSAVLRASESNGEAPDIADPPPRKLPLDVAGYLSFRTLNNDNLSEHHSYGEVAGSIFLSKKAGQWLFHSEFNAKVPITPPTVFILCPVSPT